jgi:pimeloyl-ACP methyl ester carboxylesterase
MASDIVGLLDVLGIEKAAVIWIGANSDADTFLVTIDDETLVIADAYLRVLEPEGYPGFWEKVWKANIGLLFNDEFVQSRLGSYLITSIFEERYGRYNADPTAIINILHCTRGWSIVDRLSGLSRPVQVVVGDQDPTLVYCEEQGRMAAGAEYVLMENSGHFSIMDQAERFNALALDFLRRTHA